MVICKKGNHQVSEGKIILYRYTLIKYMDTPVVLF